MQKFVGPIAITGLLFCGPAAAQIFKCDGKWTNRPCSGEIEARIEETNREPQPAPNAEDPAPAPPLDQTAPALEPMSARYDLVRKFRRRNDDLRQKNRPALSPAEVGKVERFCLESATKAQDCAARIKQAEAAAEREAKNWESELLGGDPNTLGK